MIDDDQPKMLALGLLIIAAGLLHLWSVLP